MDRRRFMATAGAVMLAPRGAGAQGYPLRPIRLIVTFAAGGPADLFARALASGMSARLGQQVVIDNRPGGAAGLPAIDAIAKAGPDGYQLALAGAAALSTVPFMIPKMPFDWETSLAPLTLVSRVPEVITTNASSASRASATSSPTRKGTRARSISARPGSAASPISPASCSRRKRRSTSPMCLIAARHPP